MSYYDYEMSKQIAKEDYPFYSLIMAAIRQADSDNLQKLRIAFPHVYYELEKRYNALAGLLEGESAQIGGVAIKMVNGNIEYNRNR